ncbi:MAG: YihY/virulence factor BrkB family protein [Bacteroidales bacterium]|nr:YihY/virulence factor BrkB family protein [Bacteroidales bacterium]
MRKRKDSLVEYVTKLPRKLLFKRPVRKFLHLIKQITLPGFQGVPIFDVLDFFIRNLLKESIANRAKAMAFSFFLALFPLLLFLFSLLPYFPIQGIINELYATLNEMLPADVYTKVVNAMDEILTHKHNVLLSVGFLGTIVVSVNGMDSIMQAFNQSMNIIETRSFVKRKLLCLYLVFLLFILVAVVLTIMMGYKHFMAYLLSQDLLAENFWYYVLSIGRWILMIAIALGVISAIYYVAPVKKQRLNFFSAGASLSTVLFFLVTAGFRLYIENFSKYNALYGSIGTLIIVMLWIQLSCMILLIGYELNISIVSTKNKNNPFVRGKIVNKTAETDVAAEDKENIIVENK